MRIFAIDTYTLPLPTNHRFPVGKYTLLRQRVTDAALGTIEVPSAASDQQLLLVHEAGYIERMQKGQMSEREMRRIGFPWSPQVVERSRRSVGATIAACCAALTDRVAVNLAGGTHHAYPDHGEGYCIFNDAAVAARMLQAEYLVQRVLVIDLDVHQGNGTAFMFANDPSVFTFSIHGAGNYPFHKEKSDLDIALADKTTDQGYLAALEHGLTEAIERSYADLAIYLAGADPYQDDALGRLSLTKMGLLQRDQMVLTACQAAGLPVAICMAGGYARQINDTVDIHMQTVQAAAQMVYQQSPKI